MRISDWSSDVCSSDLQVEQQIGRRRIDRHRRLVDHRDVARGDPGRGTPFLVALEEAVIERAVGIRLARQDVVAHRAILLGKRRALEPVDLRLERSEEHTSELQSLMRISYTVFCLKKKKKHTKYSHSYKEQANTATN